MPESLVSAWTAGLTEAVSCLEWAPDGSSLAIGCMDGTATLLDAGDGSDTTLENRHSAVLSLAWCPDGRRLALGRQDGRVSIAGRSGKGKLTRLRGWAESLAWAPDRRSVAAAAGFDASVIGLDGRILAEYPFHPGWVNDVAWDKTSGELMVATAGGVRFYDPAVSGSKPAGAAPSTGTVLALAPSPNGRLVAAGLLDSCLVWRMSDGSCTDLTGSEGAVEHLSWRSDGGRLAVGAHDELTIWSVVEDKITAEGRVNCEGTDGCPGGIGFHPSLPLVAWGGAGGAICIYAPEVRPEPVTVGRVASEISGLCWHPYGLRLAVGTRGGEIYCFELP